MNIFKCNLFWEKFIMTKKVICILFVYMFIFMVFPCLTSDFNKVYVNETKTEGGRAAEAAVVYLDVPRSVLDCSAFTQKAYSDIGLSIPRVTYEQAECGVKIYDYEKLEPGDIICMGKGAEPDNITHVGIYCGNDIMLHS